MKEEGHTTKQSVEILNELKKYDPKLADTLESLDREQAQKRLAFSALIKKASTPNASPVDKEAARLAAEELKVLEQSLRTLIDEYLRAAGITEDQLDALDKEFEAELNTVIEQDVSLRNYTPSKVTTTGVVEDVLPGALEKLLRNVSPNWLSEERKKPY